MKITKEELRQLFIEACHEQGKKTDKQIEEIWLANDESFSKLLDLINESEDK